MPHIKIGESIEDYRIRNAEYSRKRWHRIHPNAIYGRVESKLGENNPNWKGDNISKEAGRYRAKRLLNRFNINDGKEIHHIDGNPLNNDPSNLEIITRKGHMIEDGRMFNNLKQYKDGLLLEGKEMTNKQKIQKKYNDKYRNQKPK